MRELGRSGIRTGRFGIGGATFGREIGEEDSFRILDHCFERGIRLIDTAEAYGGGQARDYRRRVLGVDDIRETTGEMHSSEKIVGKWMESRGVRNEVVLLTKVTTNFTLEHVREALDASLERLRTDRVDLYLYHSFDAATPVEEAAAAMKEAVASGRARAGGCSNYSAEQLRAAARHGRPFEVVEANYNLCVRDIEAELLPLAAAERIGVITYSPLAAGFLMGKYAPGGEAPKGSRFDVIPGHADIYCNERNFAISERLGKEAAERGIPRWRLAMAWVLSNPAVDAMLIGARSTGQVDNALQAASAEHAADDYSEALRDIGAQ